MKKFEIELSVMDRKKTWVIIEAETEQEAYDKYDASSLELLMKCKWEDTEYFESPKIEDIRELK